MAIGIGLVTVAGQCIGRGRPDEAKRYIGHFTRIAAATVAITGLLVAILVPFITSLTALTPEGAQLVHRIVRFVAVMMVLLWPSAFTVPNGLRAAGDVSFTMWVSALSMWIFRVALSWYLCRYTPIGLWGVWIGWCTDWLIRAICFQGRVRTEKWYQHNVLA